MGNYTQYLVIIYLKIIYMYIFSYTHTHTHTYTHISVYLNHFAGHLKLIQQFKFTIVQFKKKGHSYLKKKKTPQTQ